MSASPASDRLDSLRRYAVPFERQRPRIFDFFPDGGKPLFPFAAGTDRGLGILLLYAALFRPGAETRIAETVAGLFRGLGLDVFKLNRIPFPALRQALGDAGPWPDAEEKKRAPGILRSVCDFFYKTRGLSQWLAAPDWEALARELSEGVFWMGKRSRLRTKARYFLWLCSFQPDFGRKFSKAVEFSWPLSDGHVRFWNDFRPRSRPPSSPEARLKRFADLGREAFPEAPWRLYQPLEAYLRPEPRHGYLCRRVQGGCRPCPLSTQCDAAKYFLPSEPRA